MNLHRMVTILVMSLFMTAGVLAQKQTPPEGGKPKDFTLPATKTLTLDNGLTATLVQYGALPKVSVSVSIRVGNLNEKESEVWLADLVGDMMKEGTTTRTSEELAEEAASMGGSVNISVGPDLTTVGGDVLSEFGPELVALLADVAMNPGFPESEFERLKNDRIRSLAVSKTRPQNLALEEFYRMLYPNHPYGRVFPTEAMVKGFTLQQVQHFFQENFGAQRTAVFIVGKFNESSMEQAIQQAFDKWDKGPEPLINIPEPVLKGGFGIVDRPGAPQSTIYLGLPVINPSEDDYVGFQVMNSLLGGSFASRITSNIREQKGYTYSPRSVISTRYRDAYWAQIADVTTSVTGAALEEIFKEITTLQNEPPTADELKGIQNYMAGTFVLRNSSRGGITGQLSFLRLHGLSEDYLTNFVKRVYAVTPEEISAFAKKYLPTETMTLAITGDKNAIQSQVEQYAKGAEIGR
jgi:predicted Zn-dependent peptidase